MRWEGTNTGGVTSGTTSDPISTDFYDPRPGACRAVATRPWHQACTRTAHLRPRWRAPRTASVSMAILGDVQCVQGGVAPPGPSLAPPGAHARRSVQLGNGGRFISGECRAAVPGQAEGAARAPPRIKEEGGEGLCLSTNRQTPTNAERLLVRSRRFRSKNNPS